MKLFVIAVLVSVAAAGRLEHLEHSYLPPNHGSLNSASSSFGSHGSFGTASGAFGGTGAGLSNINAGSSFASTSNQYHTPNHGPSSSNRGPQSGGSLTGFGHGAQTYQAQHYSSHQAPTHQAATQQYVIPSTSYGTPETANSFGHFSHQAQYSQQFAATSRQYLAPRTSSVQNSPQQPFDEQTGYHY